MKKYTHAYTTFFILETFPADVSPAHAMDVIVKVEPNRVHQKTIRWSLFFTLCPGAPRTQPHPVPAASSRPLPVPTYRTQETRTFQPSPTFATLADQGH